MSLGDFQRVRNASAKEPSRCSTPMRDCTSHPTRAHQRTTVDPAPILSGPGPAGRSAEPDDLADDTDPDGLDLDPPIALEISDDEAIDLDDRDASHLDIGISIEQLSGGSGEEGASLVLDVGELLAPLGDRGEEGAAEDSLGTGSDDEQSFLPFDRPPSELMGDLDDTEDGTMTELEGILPALDADAGGEFGLEHDGIDIPSISDDPLPSWCERRWMEASISSDAHLRCLFCSADEVLLGGRTMQWIDVESGRPRHEVPLESQALGCVAVPGGAAVVALAGGTIARMLPSTRTSETQVTRYKPHGTVGPDPETIQLVLASTPAEPTLLGLTRSGRLIRSTDQGHRWTSIELHGRVLALSRSPFPSVALLQGRRGRSLVVSADAGTNWRVLDTNRQLESVLNDVPPLLSAVAEAILVAHPLHGAFLSRDGGGTFARLTGCNNVTAVCSGELAGAPSFWLALHSDAASTSSIILVRAPTWEPVRVAELRAPSPSDGYEEAANPHVMALHWHQDSQWLWGVGEFGARRWEPFRTRITS